MTGRTKSCRNTLSMKQRATVKHDVFVVLTKVEYYWNWFADVSTLKTFDHNGWNCALSAGCPNLVCPEDQRLIEKWKAPVLTEGWKYGWTYSISPSAKVGTFELSMCPSWSRTKIPCDEQRQAARGSHEAAKIVVTIDDAIQWTFP